MKYILSPNICLRSWYLVPWAYYVKGVRNARGLKQEEYELLRLFMANPGRVFTRDQLLADVWESDYVGETRTVDVHIGRLRERFRNNTDFKIVTMRGVGYKVVKL